MNAHPVASRLEGMKPATESSGIHTWLVLMKAHRALTRHAERSIEALDMCLSDFAILEALLHKGPQAVRDLARRIDLTSGSMTTAIDRLETRQLVARTDHATDRRAWVIRLTAAGDALITKVFAGHAEAMERAMRGLSKSERAILTDLLKRLGTTADQLFTTAEHVPDRSVAREHRSTDRDRRTRDSG